MKIRESIIQLANGQEPFLNINDNIFLFPEQEGVLITFSSSDALSFIDNKEIDYLSYDIDLDTMTFADETNHDFSYRLASNIQLKKLSLENLIENDIIPSFSQLKKLSNNQPIMFKIAQWGGFGGQGNIPGIGQGLGVGNPMSGGGAFDTAIVRTQFDQSLQLARTNGNKNDWTQSLETRMQENPLYGHKRNDKDWNLKNYRMTYKERKQEKKKEFLKRMIENRKKIEINENSVENIKAAPIDPKYYIPIEEKLKNKRQQEDNIEKRKNRHGPESQFTYFPPKTVTAQTIVHNGLSSIFENDLEAMENKKAYPDAENGRLRIRQHPWVLYGPTRDDLMMNINDYPQISSQPTDLKADNNMMWGGVWNNGINNNKGGTIALDYLSDGYATHQNPGEIQEPIFDAETLPGIIHKMRQHLEIQKEANNPENMPLEKKLKGQHHVPELSGISPTNYDIQRMDDPFPYSSKNFFVPRMRMNHSNG